MMPQSMHLQQFDAQLNVHIRLPAGFNIALPKTDRMEMKIKLRQNKVQIS
jgi:hypothetical protein